MNPILKLYGVSRPYSAPRAKPKQDYSKPSPRSNICALVAVTTANWRMQHFILITEGEQYAQTKKCKVYLASGSIKQAMKRQEYSVKVPTS